jgi:DNA replication protein DnaC
MIKMLWPVGLIAENCTMARSPRHAGKPSTLITTNTAFSEWGNILHNTTIAAAIVDRLVENSEIFLLGGASLRKAQKNPPPPSS